MQSPTSSLNEAGQSVSTTMWRWKLTYSLTPTATWLKWQSAFHNNDRPLTHPTHFLAMRFRENYSGFIFWSCSLSFSFSAQYLVIVNLSFQLLCFSAFRTVDPWCDFRQKRCFSIIIFMCYDNEPRAGSSHSAERWSLLQFDADSHLSDRLFCGLLWIIFPVNVTHSRWHDG